MNTTLQTNGPMDTMGNINPLVPHYFSSRAAPLVSGKISIFFHVGLLFFMMMLKITNMGWFYNASPNFFRTTVGRIQGSVTMKTI